MGYFLWESELVVNIPEQTELAMVQNAAASLLTGNQQFDHFTPILTHF